MIITEIAPVTCQALRTIEKMGWYQHVCSEVLTAHTHQSAACVQWCIHSFVHILCHHVVCAGGMENTTGQAPHLVARRCLKRCPTAQSPWRMLRHWHKTDCAGRYRLTCLALHMATAKKDLIHIQDPSVLGQDTNQERSQPLLHRTLSKSGLMGCFNRFECFFQSREFQIILIFVFFLTLDYEEVIKEITAYLRGAWIVTMLAYFTLTGIQPHQRDNLFKRKAAVHISNQGRPNPSLNASDLSILPELIRP